MNDALDKAHTVSTALFGPDSGIPWWFWIIVVVALFWKVAVPEPKTAEDRKVEREHALVAHIAQSSSNKKQKKKK